MASHRHPMGTSSRVCGGMGKESFLVPRRRFVRRCGGGELRVPLQGFLSRDHRVNLSC